MECLCGGSRAASSALSCQPRLELDWIVGSIAGLLEWGQYLETRPGHRHSIFTDSQHIVITSNPQNTETLIFLPTKRKAFIKNSKLLTWEIFKKGKTYMLFSCSLWCCRVSATPPHLTTFVQSRLSDVQACKNDIEFYVWISTVNVTRMCLHSLHQTFTERAATPSRFCWLSTLGQMSLLFYLFSCNSLCSCQRHHHASDSQFPPIIKANLRVMVFRLSDHLEVNLTRLFCPVVLLLNTMLLIQTVTSVDLTLSSEMLNVKVAVELFHLKASWKNKQTKTWRFLSQYKGYWAQGIKSFVSKM